jgi:signal recognition particle subunit SRP54
VEEINKLIKMHRQMADMMKSMGKQRGGIFQRMMGAGGGAAPSEAEMERMRSDLGRLDPKALEALPRDLKEQLPKGLPLPGAPSRSLPRLPGLGGPSLPKFPGLPGLPGKRK